MTRKLSIAVSCFSLLACSQIAAGDTAYINGKVLTIDDDFQIAEAFIVDDNKFSMVNSNQAVLAQKPDKIIDLKGKTVIPGLIDNHNHFIRGASQWNNIVRLDGVRHRRRAKALLSEKAKPLDEDEWLLVLGGWNEQQFVWRQEGFSRAELDAISDKPIFIHSQYSHAFVNTAFLNYFNLEVQTEQPVGDLPDHPIFGPQLAELVERDASNVATGLVNGGLFMIIQVGLQMPSVNPEAAIAATKQAQADYHALGLTTVYDPGGSLTTTETYQAVESMHRDGSLTLRIFRTLWIQPNDEESVTATIAQINAAEPMLSGDDSYDTIAVGEALYIPLHDSPEHAPTVTPTALSHVDRLLTAIATKGLPAQIHAVNASTLQLYLDALNAIHSETPLQPGFVTFSHAEGINQNILSQMRNLGLTLQVRSSRLANDREQLISELGINAISQPPLRTINDSGVLWGLGTDGTKYAQINPMLTLSWAVTGRAINGDIVLSPQQTLSRKEALIAHTRNNAELVFRGSKLGQIKAGYLADFVVLNADYLTVPETKIKKLHPVLTVVDGKPVFTSPREHFGHLPSRHFPFKRQVALPN